MIRDCQMTDPDRPKNDKATILTDTIQVLKDLTAQVNRLKAEHASLFEESNEVFAFKIDRSCLMILNFVIGRMSLTHCFFYLKSS